MTVREYEPILQKEPAHADAFLALRKAYRESGKLDKLVTLYECRAQAIDDAAKAAELFYLAAVARTKDPARIAELSGEMGLLSTHMLARIERALASPARKADVTPEHLKL